jgi:cob(I)alamin adenosyltransferase
MPFQKKGLIVVHTGDGKGKTTAAMGMALRGVGHGLKTLMVQFIKGTWKYGELDAVKGLLPFFEIKPMGKGYKKLTKQPPHPEDVQAAEEAWSFVKDRIFFSQYHMIILDEINVAMHYHLIPVEEVMEVLKSKPEAVHLVLTGRNAHPDIMEIADLVTEMKEIKHPYNKGVKAQKGIEF